MKQKTLLISLLIGSVALGGLVLSSDNTTQEQLGAQVFSTSSEQVAVGESETRTATDLYGLMQVELTANPKTVKVGETSIVSATISFTGGETKRGRYYLKAKEGLWAVSSRVFKQLGEYFLPTYDTQGGPEPRNIIEEGSHTFSVQYSCREPGSSAIVFDSTVAYTLLKESRDSSGAVTSVSESHIDRNLTKDIAIECVSDDAPSGAAQLFGQLFSDISFSSVSTPGATTTTTPASTTGTTDSSDIDPVREAEIVQDLMTQLRLDGGEKLKALSDEDLQKVAEEYRRIIRENQDIDILDALNQAYNSVELLDDEEFELLEEALRLTFTIEDFFATVDPSSRERLFENETAQEFFEVLGNAYADALLSGNTEGLEELIEEINQFIYDVDDESTDLEFQLFLEDYFNVADDERDVAGGGTAPDPAQESNPTVAVSVDTTRAFGENVSFQDITPEMVQEASNNGRRRVTIDVTLTAQDLEGSPGDKLCIQTTYVDRHGGGLETTGINSLTFVTNPLLNDGSGHDFNTVDTQYDRDQYSLPEVEVSADGSYRFVLELNPDTFGPAVTYIEVINKTTGTRKTVPLYIGTPPPAEEQDQAPEPEPELEEVLAIGEFVKTSGGVSYPISSFSIEKLEATGFVSLKDQIGAIAESTAFNGQLTLMNEFWDGKYEPIGLTIEENFDKLDASVGFRLILPEGLSYIQPTISGVHGAGPKQFTGSSGLEGLAYALSGGQTAQVDNDSCPAPQPEGQESPSEPEYHKNYNECIDKMTHMCDYCVPPGAIITESCVEMSREQIKDFCRDAADDTTSTEFLEPVVVLC